eukprot:352336-Chlamydomonas_euryale.AAC.5
MWADSSSHCTITLPHWCEPSCPRCICHRLPAVHLVRETESDTLVCKDTTQLHRGRAQRRGLMKRCGILRLTAARPRSNIPSSLKTSVVPRTGRPSGHRAPAPPRPGCRWAATPSTRRRRSPGRSYCERAPMALWPGRSRAGRVGLPRPSLAKPFDVCVKRTPKPQGPRTALPSALSASLPPLHPLSCAHLFRRGLARPASRRGRQRRLLRRCAGAAAAVGQRVRVGRCCTAHDVHASHWHGHGARWPLLILALGALAAIAVGAVTVAAGAGECKGAAGHGWRGRVRRPLFAAAAAAAAATWHTRRRHGCRRSRSWVSGHLTAA